MSSPLETDDPFDLARFVTAQQRCFEEALDEIRRGHKETHWMWFIFPQIDGLGSSSTAKRYAIRSKEEAEAYLRHPVLGPRLVQCANALLSAKGRSASAIFGFPDDLKLRSSMTLFAWISGDGSAFHQVIERFFGGECDSRTVELLAQLSARTESGPTG